MSGAHSPAGGDPSMEDILASIRRILSEDEASEAPQSARPGPSHETSAPASNDVLTLDSSMMVEESRPRTMDVPPTLGAAMSPAAPARPAQPARSPEPTSPPPIGPASATASAPLPAETTHTVSPAAMAPKMPEPIQTAPVASDHHDLVAPETAAAAASSVGELLRRVQTERGTAVSRNGPTIEDVVRDEIRPILKQWLDTNLPPIVERLVRAEIERVVNRAVG